MKLTFFILFISLIIHVEDIYAQYKSKVWVPDLENGYYKNPIIHSDYSDPDVCRVGDTYYMTSSSFNCIPGLPILESEDLVNWRIVNYALKNNLPTDYYNVPRHGKGVWAPSIRYHKGMFYIYWGDPDFGIYMVKTSDIYGEWDKPVLVKAGKGMIDPTPLWDDDGKVYLIHAWAGSRSGLNSILSICEMTSDGTSIVSNPVIVYDGNDGINHTIEGPKLYKKEGYYYIFAPAGGVKNGWQVVLRSDKIYGPYESKIVMSQGNTDINGPHQGAWVDTDCGESWFIHFQDKGLYGRVIHLNPIRWIEDWPVIGIDKDGDGCGEPVKEYCKPKVKKKTMVETPVDSDEFNSCKLGLQWQWHANFQETFGFTTSSGYMRIYNYIKTPDFRNLWQVPNLLLQKFTANEFVVSAKVKVTAKYDGQISGLVVMGIDYACLGVEKFNDKFLIKFIECHDAENLNTEIVTIVDSVKPSKVYDSGLIPNYEVDIFIKIEVSDYGICTFYYSTDGLNYKCIDKNFKAKQGKWIGAKTGIFSVSSEDKDRGWIDVDWFRLEKKE